MAPIRPGLKVMRHRAHWRCLSRAAARSPRTRKLCSSRLQGAGAGIQRARDVRGRATRRADADPGTGIPDIGRHHQPRCGGRIQRRQGTGFERRAGRAPAWARPARPTAGCHRDCSEAGRYRQSGEPDRKTQVVSLLGGAGAPAAEDEHSVEDHMACALFAAAGRYPVQGGSLPGRRIDALMQAAAGSAPARPQRRGPGRGR